MRKIFLAALLVFLFAPVSGWPANLATGGASANGEIERGEQLYREGRIEDAYRLLMRAVFRNPESPANSPAYHILARIFLDRDQPDRALAILSRIPEKNRTDLTRILRGDALIRSGHGDEGLALLNRLSVDAISAEERFLYFEAMAEGKARRGKPLEALFFRHQAASQATQHHDSVRILAEVSRIGQEIAGTALSREALFMFQATATGHVLSLREAEKLAGDGKSGEALGLIQPILESRIDFPCLHEATELYRRITGTSWERKHTVGVLLPLTGKFASFGKMVQRGVELALETFNQEGKGEIRFRFQDTAADPAVTVGAVQDLSRREGVTAFLGPLSGNAAEAGGRQAQQEGIPLLALSPREGIPEIGSYVFRTSLTGEAQVATLLRYAIAGRGLTRFAILYPADAMGREFADLFGRQAAAMGGRVVASRSYPAEATDFRESILRLFDNNPTSPQKAFFEALFIPDFGERVGLLVSQLLYYDIEGVQLLGINSWNTPELIHRGGKAMEGAVFTDGFFPESANPRVRDFVKNFQERFGESPSILDAQGYDSAALLLGLLQDPQVRTRDELQRAISRVRDYPGITGSVSFRGNGEGEKSLYLLRIRGGSIEQLD
ncbi:MAG: ABC transporter substrate-binding protein [Desulfuromonadaceae bacterium]|nr:ABC transporter substrate-binding protein [Desulfuromonadaceae bacterium]